MRERHTKGNHKPQDFVANYFWSPGYVSDAFSDRSFVQFEGNLGQKTLLELQ